VSLETANGKTTFVYKGREINIPSTGLINIDGVIFKLPGPESILDNPTSFCCEVVWATSKTLIPELLKYGVKDVLKDKAVIPADKVVEAIPEP
jgi:hypothetical protein